MWSLGLGPWAVKPLGLIIRFGALGVGEGSGLGACGRSGAVFRHLGSGRGVSL